MEVVQTSMEEWQLFFPGKGSAFRFRHFHDAPRQKRAVALEGCCAFRPSMMTDAPPPATSCDTPCDAPLAGVTVIDVGTFIAGPLAATHLAQLGATVIHVIRPASARGAREEAAFKPQMLAALRDKKQCVTIDLSSDRDALVDLLKTADVLITNYSAETLAKHGLDAASCMAVRPGLVHVWLSGFALSDTQLPSAPPAAWEAILMASCGIFRDMGLNRQLLGVAASYSPLPLASTYASVWAACATCAALYRNAKLDHPSGEAIEVPLASALLRRISRSRPTSPSGRSG